MKNIILIFFALFSCSMIDINYSWYKLKRLPDGINDKSTLADIYNWQIDNIAYKFYANGFHPAQKTLDEKNGNCANKALLLLAIVYKINCQKGKLVFCECKDGILHYTVKFNGKMFDVEENKISKIFEEIDFDDIAEYIYLRQGI